LTIPNSARARVERLEREEMPMLDSILKIRSSLGLTQAQVAERMGTKTPAVARLESALVTGNYSPSLATLRKYAAAMGKRVQAFKRSSVQAFKCSSAIYLRH
jgi:transcriptional regulator with XRE-family HTH domain